MTARSHHRGLEIYFDEASGLWRFESDDAPVRDHWRTRPCGKCGELLTKKRHDACIADLPGVNNACCGHGHDEDAYVDFEDGRYESGSTAALILKQLTKEK
jgi:hypothetical protein